MVLILFRILWQIIFLVFSFCRWCKQIPRDHHLLNIIWLEVEELDFFLFATPSCVQRLTPNSELMYCSWWVEGTMYHIRDRKTEQRRNLDWPCARQAHYLLYYCSCLRRTSLNQIYIPSKFKNLSQCHFNFLHYYM